MATISVISFFLLRISWRNLAYEGTFIASANGISKPRSPSAFFYVQDMEVSAHLSFACLLPFVEDRALSLFSFVVACCFSSSLL